MWRLPSALLVLAAGTHTVSAELPWDTYTSSDLYESLGLHSTAHPRDIRWAWRLAALEFHPDSETRDERLFRNLHTSYQLLIDEDTRVKYDKFGLAGNSPCSSCLTLPLQTRRTRWTTPWTGCTRSRCCTTRRP
jgi:preprotein translocase subunit Sec63